MFNAGTVALGFASYMAWVRWLRSVVVDTILKVCLKGCFTEIDDIDAID